MNVITLNGEVIHIGDWDYELVPIRNNTKYTENEIIALTELGRSPDYIYDDDGNVKMMATNPLPNGAIEEDREVISRLGGGRCVADNYKLLRRYPSIAEQLDYIYHNGIKKWKADMVKPIKDAYPKK